MSWPHIMSAELAFKETDHSLLAGQTLQMCVWDAQNIEPPVVDPNPASRTELVELVALHFPFSLFGNTFVRYYSAAVAGRIWNQRICRGCPKLHASRTSFC
jgi:hypothetical protein